MITSFFISKPPLQQIINERNGDITEFTYDPWDNLVSATYEQHQQLLTIYKAPDAIGNLFETQNQTDRKYQSAQLQHDGKWYYHYDKEGNLILKTPSPSERVGVRQWTLGSWAYEWNANGSLKSVKKPSGQTISFEYDALGRRTAKRSGNKEILYIWSGNVLLHEVFKTNDNKQVITWVYEQGSFVPSAKLIDGEAYSIVSDYLGTPIRAYDEEGDLVWERELDIYGKVKTETRESANFVPFRYQGQYYDSEIDLCYNRFRYYDCNTGTYISQDPIGLFGNNPNIYAYVFDSNTEVDVFGLDVYGLYTTTDGWYPVYTKGQAQPTSYVFMKKDELYKIGESQNPTKRYSKIALNEGRINRSGAKSVAADVNGNVILGQTAGLRMRPISQGGTKKADRVLENQLLENYKKQNGGNLPAGNKTCH